MENKLQKRLDALVYVAPTAPRVAELLKLPKAELIVRLLEEEEQKIDARHEAMGEDL